MEKEKAKEYLVRRISSQETYEDLLKFPRYLEIETVNVCNARCPMCTITDWERGGKPMSDELYKKIADEIIAHSNEIIRVSLYRDGEPLIDPKLAQRIAMLKQGGIKDVTISTNVSLLTEEKSKDLLNAGIDTIIMSIDSLKKQVYESIRVRLNFEKVMENALRFIELRNKIRPETKIWMRMIRQESNYDEWSDYHKYWDEKLEKQDRIYFHNVFNWGGQLKGYTPITKTYEPNLPCVALWSLIVIFTDGRVPLCNVDFNNKYPTGSVVTHSIEELWKSKIMNQRRELHLLGKKADVSLCKNCNVWEEPLDKNGKTISEEYASPVDVQL